jgi:co-chaperonin GroES (HSP10)
MKLINNYVLIKPAETNTKAGSIHLNLDQANKTYPRHGTVVAVPDKLIWYGDKVKELRNKLKYSSRNSRDQSMQMELGRLNSLCLGFKTNQELQVGDDVYFSWMGYEQRKEYEDNCFIKYDELYVAKRGEKIIPLNGKILIEPTPENLGGNIIEMVKESPTKGIVRYLGSCVEYRDYGYKDKEELKVGDKVRFNATANITLEYEIFNTFGEKLFAMNRKDIYQIL